MQNSRATEVNLNLKARSYDLVLSDLIVLQIHAIVGSYEDA